MNIGTLGFREGRGEVGSIDDNGAGAQDGDVLLTLRQYLGTSQHQRHRSVIYLQRQDGGNMESGQWVH